MTAERGAPPEAQREMSPEDKMKKKYQDDIRHYGIVRDLPQLLKQLEDAANSELGGDLKTRSELLVRAKRVGAQRTEARTAIWFGHEFKYDELLKGYDGKQALEALTVAEAMLGKEEERVRKEIDRISNKDLVQDSLHEQALEDNAKMSEQPEDESVQ